MNIIRRLAFGACLALTAPVWMLLAVSALVAVAFLALVQGPPNSAQARQRDDLMCLPARWMDLFAPVLPARDRDAWEMR